MNYDLLKGWGDLSFSSLLDVTRGLGQRRSSTHVRGELDLTELGKSPQWQTLDPPLLRRALRHPRASDAWPKHEEDPTKGDQSEGRCPPSGELGRRTAGLAGLLQPPRASALQSRAPLGTAHHGKYAAATTQGPLQLVQERYKSMTNICNLKIGQSFAII